MNKTFNFLRKSHAKQLNSTLSNSTSFLKASVSFMQQEEEQNRKLNKVKKYDVDEKNENQPFGNIFMNMS